MTQKPNQVFALLCAITTLFVTQGTTSNTSTLLENFQKITSNAFTHQIKNHKLRDKNHGDLINLINEDDIRSTNPFYNKNVENDIKRHEIQREHTNHHKQHENNEEDYDNKPNATKEHYQQGYHTDHKHEYEPSTETNNNMYLHIDAKVIRQVSPRTHDHGHDHDHTHSHYNKNQPTQKNDEDTPTISDSNEHSKKALSWTVWLTSLGSICVISVLGLVAVAAIPLLQGPHQDTLLQLLVSLAIGTLVGDALIHLLPHALDSEHGEHGHVLCCWKGFVATMTIIALFVVDQIMESFGHGHDHGRKDNHKNADRDEKKVSEDAASYTTLPLDEKSEDLCTEPILESGGSDYCDTLVEKTCSKQHISSISSSAKMVIVGDAIHNFADGLAIGAAFSISIAAGFSTSLAVLCHELPHEVGDFALLLHSGMQTKTAILFNIFSSIFAVFGLLSGLLLGSSEGYSSWLLSSTVGVFIYVALGEFK